MSNAILTFKNRWFRLAVVLLLVGGLIAILLAFRGVMLPFVFAFVVAYVMEPLVRRMNQRSIFGFFMPRWSCVIVIYLAFFGVLSLIVIFVLPPMYEELRTSVEREWPPLKDKIDAWLEEPKPAPDEEKKPEAVSGLEEEEEKPPDPKAGEISAPPPVTREDLRRTDLDGEVAFVPRRVGPAVINLYPDSDAKSLVDAYIEYLNKKRATPQGEPQPAPPTPAYSTAMVVLPAWEVETKEPIPPGPRKDAEPKLVTRVGAKTEFRVRRLGAKQEGVFVEIVYPASDGLEEYRDWSKREFEETEEETGEKEKRSKVLDLYEVGRDFLRHQTRNGFNWFSKEAESQLQKSVEYIGPVVGAVFKTIFTIVLILMLAAFISSDVRRIQTFVFDLVPPRVRPQFEELMGSLDRGLSGVVRGQLVICLVNGCLTGIGLKWLGVPFWHVLTLLATVLMLIPIFGTILSSVPAIIFGLTVSFGTGLGVLAWICGIHALEAYVLNPKIIGHSAHIHPVLVIFALVAGEYAYGLIGALLGVPVVSIVQNLFLFFHKRLVSASEEEAQRTGVFFPRRPRVIEQEEEEIRRARDEGGKKRERPGPVDPPDAGGETRP
ncbi:MAG: AI-2E family transporter [Planctomycetes bacterium]|nr:AI-2E family transporter [Planctomycetota bacterium]